MSQLFLEVLEITEVWRQGFATEATRAILNFAFKALKLRRVIALIHPENLPSEKVAIKLGMILGKEIERHGQIKKLFVIERHHLLKDSITGIVHGQGC